MQGTASHHDVIVGGGFAGLYAAQSLRRAPVRITLIDRRNFHPFQPLLYQVATGRLSPADIASPFRSISADNATCASCRGTSRASMQRGDECCWVTRASSTTH
jgi:NADH dehydrogenase FAD-containing subunit